MIHINIFENFNPRDVDLVLSEETPAYKSFNIYLNSEKIGTIDVGFYKKGMKEEEAEIIGIFINEKSQKKGIGKIAIKKLFMELPNVNLFLVMPTVESFRFWENIGAYPYSSGYLGIDKKSF